MKSVDTVLIDADITAFQVCSVAEVEIEWHEEVWSLYSDFKEVKADFADAVSGIIELTGAKTAVLAFTDTQNFRKSVYGPYKGNRKGRKPMNYKRLKDWASETWETYVWPNLEGDDVLGVLATSNPHVGIYSADKDMKTLPVTHWDGEERFWRPYSLLEADWWFMYQTLTGDSTDGYPGCPGIGPKRAADILGPVAHRPITDLWPDVVQAFESKGLTEEDAIQQARCARILRHEDYNQANGDIRLWNPPHRKTETE